MEIGLGVETKQRSKRRHVNTNFCQILPSVTRLLDFKLILNQEIN